MSELTKNGRRAFIKSSLVLGVAAVGSSGRARNANHQTSRLSELPVTTPSAAIANAETGQIGAELRFTSEREVVEHPGSDYMVDLLKAAKITYVCAMVGSTFRGLHESIVNYGGNTDPELIVCVHEEISVAAAHGYYKVAGAPMACMLHGTVGLQHASMAIYNAWCDRVPIMLLVGNGIDGTKRRPGVEWLHTAQDLGAFVRDYVKWDSAPISLGQYGEDFMRAMQISLTPPCDPVLVVVDSELQENSIPEPARTILPRLSQIAPPAAEPNVIGGAADLLVNSENPLIAADRLARTAGGVRHLVQLAELLNAPVIDRGGRMNMPTNHYLNHSGLQSQLLRSADVILGLELTDIWGLVNNVADEVERKAVRLARADAKIIGISASYGFAHSNIQDDERYFASDLTLSADGETALPQLIEAIDKRLTPVRKRQIADRKPAMEAAFSQMRSAAADAAALGWDASPISTARLSMEVWHRIQHLDWGLVSSTAFISSWPQRLWDIVEHHQYIGGEGGYGVGYGLAAATGAALAHRDAGRIAVSIQTDGDVLMLPGALWTLAHHSLPLLCVMHNNRAWHQESMHLKRMSSRRNRGPESWGVGTVITGPEVDFAALARSMGVWAEGPIADPAKLGDALDRALVVVKSGKPALLDVLTQPR